MTNSSLSHIEFILDRSGSMQSIQSDVEGGFAAFIDEQRRQPGECTVSLVCFDDLFERVFDAIPLAEVGPLRLEPRGMTALLDAIGRSVTELGERLARLPEDDRPGSVTVAIMTDGQENASREWTHAAVHELITRQEAVYNWTFLYLGADQDAIEVGAGLGIGRDQALTFDRDSSVDAFAFASESVATLRAYTAMGAPVDRIREASAFTPAQRTKAAGRKRGAAR